MKINFLGGYTEGWLNSITESRDLVYQYNNTHPLSLNGDMKFFHSCWEMYTLTALLSLRFTVTTEKMFFSESIFMQIITSQFWIMTK